MSLGACAVEVSERDAGEEAAWSAIASAHQQQLQQASFHRSKARRVIEVVFSWKATLLGTVAEHFGFCFLRTCLQRIF